MADDIATGLPDLTLLPGSIITVQVDAGSVVETLTLHGFQLSPEDTRGATPILLPAEKRSGV